MTTPDNTRVALIVGGTGAIGHAAASAFAGQHFDVIISGRDEKAAEDVLRSIDEAGAGGLFLPCDLTDPAAIEKMSMQAVNYRGRIDVAFNNAGWEGVAAQVDDIDEQDWQRMMDIKLSGTWRCMKFELRQMLKQGSGSIVNMAGNWGLVGFPQYGAYCAAAHGVMGLTRTAALEYAAKGIRVNAVCPGAVDTPLLDRIFGGSVEAREGFAAGLPLGRIATAAEVAEAVLWLASDSASYVNGHALELTGGS